ncbi:nucleoporin Nup85-like protein [Crucibulum laeve]|uniref:Nuclear pore complex protein Nup85 n=1 Tax=Crucibulum laeve TaxID=68775 RepID=A0A5C3M218_9AGAR|nr:nucleoporin Nup85-like protein [Crucibulum laeve]
MSTLECLNLLPPLADTGHFGELVHSGQTISTSTSPLNNSLAVFVTNTNSSRTEKLRSSSDEEQPIYFVNLDAVPSSERRLFISDTLIIFAAFQNLMKTARLQEADWIQSDQSLTMIRKLAIDYVNFIKECWVHASQPIPRLEPLQFSSDHYRTLYTCFSLFVVLYLPEPGYERAPVGDELMEWLNVHFIEPSTEEGDHLSALDQPWEDESFWPYLTRTILRGLSKASLFFLGVLAHHPSAELRQLASTLIPLVDSQPRLQNFTAERDFAYASRRWDDKVKALRIEMDRVSEEDRYDDFDNWWDRLSDIVGILEGRPEVIKRVCEELGADWKEVCVAWSIFIDSRLRRQDLPDIVSQVLDDLPPDPTSLEDMVHAALFSGQPMQALEHAAQLDRWLAAHLADIMEPLSLIEPEIDEDSEVSTRDQYILSYAEYLHSDPALWRITVDYMYSCGDVGKQRADEVLVRVPLNLHEQTLDSNAEKRIRAGDVVGVLKDVNQTCFEYQREAIRRTVCRIATQTLVQEKDYALAVSYCTSAEDWSGLGRVVDRVLDEYISSGPHKFSQYASAIAPTIQDIRAQSTPHGVFVHRLIFAVRYAYFHELLEKQQYQNAASEIMTILEEAIAPKSWWAVVLCDVVPILQYGPSLLSSQNAALLLQRVEEIFIGTSQGSGDDYLSVLVRTTKHGGEKEALDRLKAVRLALARYFTRDTLLNA